VLLGPFTQLVTMRGLPLEGPIADSALEIIADAGVLCKGKKIVSVGKYQDLAQSGIEIWPISESAVAFPGLVDAHTHLCWAGDRSQEYCARLSGKRYEGGGILSTVKATRSASKALLLELVLNRLKQHLKQGVTTCEIKSGYGLDVENELKILQVISEASKLQPIYLVSTCLAAHTLPTEFTDHTAYLKYICEVLWPTILKEKLSKRIDIFVDDHGFPSDVARNYLQAAINQGFEITLHADQFSKGGGTLAAELHARSADHLELTDKNTAQELAKSKVVTVALPGATLGLGISFPPARMLLDTGNCLAIASDWNPGTAPMGDLLTQAALLGAAEHLSMSETWAGITFRAAKALGLNDRGRIIPDTAADLAIFACKDWREVLYYQGALKPTETVCGGKRW